MDIEAKSTQDTKFIMQVFRDFRLRGFDVPMHLLDEGLREKLAVGDTVFFYVTEGGHVTGFAFGSAEENLFSARYSRVKSVAKHNACLLLLIDSLYREAEKKGCSFFRLPRISIHPRNCSKT